MGSMREDDLSVTPLEASSSRRVGTSAGSVAKSTSRNEVPPPALSSAVRSSWRPRRHAHLVSGSTPHDELKTTRPPASTSSAASAAMWKSVAGLPGHATSRSTRPYSPRRRDNLSRRRACGSGEVDHGIQPWKIRRNSSGSAPASTWLTCTPPARAAACVYCCASCIASVSSASGASSPTHTKRHTALSSSNTASEQSDE